jgi:hypothetical protein
MTYQTNIDAYNAIVAIAQQAGWPRQYKNDLFKGDYSALCYPRNSDAPVSFGWILREYGTTLIDPRDHLHGSWTKESLQRAFSGQSYNEKDCRFYWINGCMVVEMSLADFCTTFHAQKMRYLMID